MIHLRNNVLSTYFRKENLGVLLICFSYLLIIFSSPMPAVVSWVEVLMGGVLIFGGLALITPARSFIDENAQLLFLSAMLISFPLIVGVIGGNAFSNMIRDIVPLLYQLGIPIILLSQTKRVERFPKELIVLSLLIVGCISSIQFLIGIDNLYGSISNFIGVMTQGLEGAEPPRAGVLLVNSAILSPEEFVEAQKNYFLKAYEPGVIFSAIYMSCSAIKCLLNYERRVWRALLIILLAMVCIAPMSVLVLRAYLLVFCLSCATYFICLLQNQSRILKAQYYVIGLIVFLCMAFALYMSGVMQLFVRKQVVVGTNGKLSEWAAVIGMLSKNPALFFHGIGWGGILNNPAYPSHVSRFTHSVLSFYLLKGGVAGFLLFIAVLHQLLAQAKIGWRFILSRCSITLVSVSSLATLFMGLLFQPTYKMLGFGMILALLILDWRDDAKRT